MRHLRRIESVRPSYLFSLKLEPAKINKTLAKIGFILVQNLIRKSKYQIVLSIIRISSSSPIFRSKNILSVKNCPVLTKIVNAKFIKMRPFRAKSKNKKKKSLSSSTKRNFDFNIHKKNTVEKFIGKKKKYMNMTKRDILKDYYLHHCGQVGVSKTVFSILIGSRLEF